VREVVLARVHALTEPTQQLLAASAIAGRRVDHELLAEVTGLAPDALVARLREAVDRHVLVVDDGTRGGAYGFRHALVQEAVYDELLEAQRVRLHAAYARAMARRLDTRGERAAVVAASALEAGQLAHHWHAARDVEQAVPAYARAGVAADAAAAQAEALRYYEQAAALWEQAPRAAAHSPLDRAALLERAAEAACVISERERAIMLAEEARTHIDPADALRLGALLGRLARYHWDGGDRAQARATIERAVATIPVQPPSRERAGVLAADARLLMLQGRNEEARRRCRQAIAVARTVNAAAEEGHALTTSAL
jgi:predicted ATPase